MSLKHISDLGKSVYWVKIYQFLKKMHIFHKFEKFLDKFHFFQYFAIFYITFFLIVDFRNFSFWMELRCYIIHPPLQKRSYTRCKRYTRFWMKTLKN